MGVWVRTMQEEAVKVNLSSLPRLRTEPKGSITITQAAAVPELLNAKTLTLFPLFLLLASAIYRHNKSATLTLLLSWWTLGCMTPARAFHLLALTASLLPTHRLLAQKHQSVNKITVWTTIQTDREHLELCSLWCCYSKLATI